MLAQLEARSGLPEPADEFAALKRSGPLSHRRAQRSGKASRALNRGKSNRPASSALRTEGHAPQQPGSNRIERSGFVIIAQAPFPDQSPATRSPAGPFRPAPGLHRRRRGRG